MENTNNNGSILGPIAGAVANVGTGLLGMITQNAREKRAMKNTQKLMGIQQKNQMQLDKYGQELQLDTWKRTSYPAQVEMLKEAGLNPGLLYGNGGPGGVTGSQGGGSAASGSAPTPQQSPMDLGNAIMMAKQIELLEAQKQKVNAETQNVTANTTGKDIENNWSYATLSDRIMQVLNQQEISRHQLELVQQQSKFYTEQAKAEITKLGADAQNSQKEAALKDIELNWMNSMKAVKIGSTAIDSIINVFKLWIVKQK